MTRVILLTIVALVSSGLGLVVALLFVGLIVDPFDRKRPHD